MKARKFKSDSGQVIVPAAIAIVAMIGMMGLALDAGNLYYSQRKLQMIADSAAVAGAQQAATCTGFLVCGVMKAAATAALVENGITSATVLTDCVSSATSGVTLLLNNPPCSRGTADPNHGKAGYVEAVVTQAVPTTFIRLLGINSVSISARAEAGHTGGGNCIYALDQSGFNAITVDLSASLSATCGVIDESSSFAAASCNAFATINVTQFKVVGGVQNFLCNISPAITTGASIPSPADPLAYLPTPSMPSCGTSTASPFHGSTTAVFANALQNTHAVFYADSSYCGGIFIGAGANVTFQPGTYVLQPWLNQHGVGGLQIDLGATVTGKGVTFFNSGTTSAAPILFLMTAINNGGSVTLTAPTSGTYAGILFFQPSSNQSTATLLGASSLNSTLEGTYYFPSSRVNIALSGRAQYNILVAKDISFTLFSYALFSSGSSSFSNNLSGLLSGTPLNDGSATLVQ